MKEKIVESWLDNSTERTFQSAFCFMLAIEGYRVLHLTRHCEMEFGKDVIAIDPAGIPCAFQLKSGKGGRIKLSDWRKEIQDQLITLVEYPIIFPGIKATGKHRSVFVTNGELEDSVIRCIDDLNRKWEDRQSGGKLEVITRGDLLLKAFQLQDQLWPNELKEIELLLEMVLCDGKACVPKDKIAALLENVMPVKKQHGKQKPSGIECKRALASAALLCSIALKNYSEKNNYIAEIEGWGIYLSYLFMMVEQWNLPQKYWKNECIISVRIIENLLKGLCKELKDRKNLLEGDVFFDSASLVLKYRVTVLIGYMALCGLLLRKSDIDHDDSDSEREEYIYSFIKKNEKRMWLWGESALPYFLACYLYCKSKDASLGTVHLLYNIIITLCYANSPDFSCYRPLANPYYDAEHILNDIWSTSDDKIEEEFKGSSYYLYSLFLLYVKNNFKQHCKTIWPEITKIDQINFKCSEHWQFFRWRNKEGCYVTKEIPKTKNWSELCREANEYDKNSIPRVLEKYPSVSLLLLIIMPFRVNSDIIKWLDSIY